MFSQLLKLIIVGRDGKFAAVTTNACWKYEVCKDFKTEFPYYFNERHLPFIVREKKVIHSNNEAKIILILSTGYIQMLATRITYALLITNNVKPNRDWRIKTSQRRQLLAITFHKVWSISDCGIFSKRYFWVCHAIYRPQDNTIRWIYWLAYIPSRQLLFLVGVLSLLEEELQQHHRCEAQSGTPQKTSSSPPFALAGAIGMIEWLTDWLTNCFTSVNIVICSLKGVFEV